MSIQSIDRAFDIIELISRNPQGITLSEMANALSLPISTVYRIAADLVKKGYAEKNAALNTYKIGSKFLMLSSPFLVNLELKTEAHPFLMELSGQVGFPVFLAVMMDHEVSYLDKVDSRQMPGEYSIIGQKRSLFTTSLGKSLLFNHSEGDIRNIIEEKGMIPYTLYSITDPEVFLKDLGKCRERGWSSDNQEDRLDFRCVGVPVYGHADTIVAAISCSWDKSFFGSIDPEEMALKVRGCADRISEHLISQSH
ncbi:MAG: IclR family transcriptional regulator [Spirochaetales bacterium]|nr:IclR family transcriptional regulator [Spirochaetales bacterium]